VASLEDFDRYVEENSIADGDLAQAFADWLAKASGKQASANGGQGIRTPTVIGQPREPNVEAVARAARFP
jgi:hypothetical protein